MLDDIHGKRGPVVGVGNHVPAPTNPGGELLAKNVSQRTKAVLVLGEQPEHALVEARGMGHELGHRHGSEGVLWNGEISQVLVDVGLEIDGTALDKLHDGGPDEELRDRANAEEVSSGSTGVRAATSAKP